MPIIVWAGHLLTAAGEHPLPGHAVCVDGHHIIAVGPRNDLAARFPDAASEGGDNYLLMPALINGHDHGRGIGTMPLGVEDDLLELWLPGLFSQPALDPYLLAAYDAIRLLQSGVGVTAHSHNPQAWSNMADEVAATLRGYGDAGIRVALHPPVVDQNALVYAGREEFLTGLPTTVREAAQPFLVDAPVQRQEYFSLCKSLHDRYQDADQHRVHIQISPAGGAWCSDELIQEAVELARQRGMRVQMHLLETRYQRAYAYRRWSKSFIRHLADLGALGPWLTLAHMVWVDRSDLPLLADHGVGVVHNPSSNLRLRSGLAPLADLLAASIPLGVGLDGHALDDDQDYLRELRLAWTLANRPGAMAPKVSATDILTMGTTGGAAMTMDGAPLGRLAAGYLADLVLVDWDEVKAPWASPEVPLPELLLRRAARHHVVHVMVHGRWVIRDGRATGVDQAAVEKELARALSEGDRDDGSWRRAAGALAPYLRRFYAGWE